MDIITATYLANTAFILIILGILYVSSSSLSQQPQSRSRCHMLILSAAAYVIMDGIFVWSSLAEGLPMWIFPTAVFFFYIAYVLFPFFWQRFVRNFVGLKFSKTSMYLELIPLIILLALVLTDPFTYSIWSFDYTRDGVAYVRGPLFSFYSYLNYFYYIEPFIYAIIIYARKQQDEEPYLKHALLITIIPLVGAAINNIVIPVYEIFPFQPLCSLLVVILAYLFMAKREADMLQISHQSAIQEALGQAQTATKQALDASKVKSDFLSNMSHDIRTPMNAIINLEQLALEEEDPKVVHEYLEKMSISSKFLLGLINDILDMSRIESGELVLNKERLTRSEFLNTVGTVIRPLMEARHINFHEELKPGEYTILVDKLRFNQIFFNLLSNAAKFTPEGGDVWFTVTNMEAENDRLHIRFVVRDNGIGMSEEFLDHLFEPFAREHSSLSNEQRGSGLGLPIVKNLVDAMGGTIQVKSELGKGSEFIVDVTVDIAEKKDSPVLPSERKVETPDLTGMNILMAEDNELNTYVATIILEQAGCKVNAVVNGEEALNAFKDNEPGTFDAILMDVRMPIMDGIQATLAIRELPRPDAKEIPIIAMTADAFDDERKRTLDSGMNYHLSKPVDAQKMYQVLAECWGGYCKSLKR